MLRNRLNSYANMRLASRRPPSYLRAIANGAAQAVVQLALLRPVALFRQRLADIEKQLVGYDVALKIVACRHF